MKAKVNPNLFKNSRVGRTPFQALRHKNGKALKDVEYFELLGRHCIELDKLNPNKALPTDYGTFDRNTCEVAKQVARAIDDGVPMKQLEYFVASCIDHES